MYVCIKCVWWLYLKKKKFGIYVNIFVRSSNLNCVWIFLR